MPDNPISEPVAWGYVLIADGRPINRVHHPVKRGYEQTRGSLARHVQGSHQGTAKAPDSPCRSNLRGHKPCGNVLVPASECLGLSEPDAQWFLGELAARGVRLIVNGGSLVIAPDDDKTELAGTVARFQKAQHMRR